MEYNLTSRLVSKYVGNMVYSSSGSVVNTRVELTGLNNVLAKVSFELDGRRYMFRTVLSDQEEGVLMLVEDRITDHYILAGVSGFLYQKPNVHGGHIHKLDSFYFHVRLNFYDGTQTEVFFMGKEEEKHRKLREGQAQKYRMAIGT